MYVSFCHTVARLHELMCTSSRPSINTGRPIDRHPP